MTNTDYDTGISNEVFTVKSSIKMIDIFNLILEKKSLAVIELFESLMAEGVINKDSSIVIAGTYFTGLAIAKYLACDNYGDITIVDIYPHLEGFIGSSIGNPLIEAGNGTGFNHVCFDSIKFSSDLDLIKKADVVIDTTGLGGISEDQSKSIHAKAFIIEDPIAEENDVLLKDKNNIYKRANLVDSDYKFVLKTTGLNTKTSGTMTFAMDVLRQSLNSLLANEGVLYCSCEMTFYEEIVFKEKNLDKFLELIESPVIKVSTICPFDCDDIIKEFVDCIHSEILVEW